MLRCAIYSTLDSHEHDKKLIKALKKDCFAIIIKVFCRIGIPC